MKHENDDDVSSTEAMMDRRRKLRKTMATNVTPSSSYSKMATNVTPWTKKDDILILSGIVDYHKKSELRFNQSWDTFYGYMRGTMKSDFSKKQLSDKVSSLKRRFRANEARANDGKELSFTNADAEQVFKLSKIIWDENETECAHKDNIDIDLTKEDVPCAEHERVTNANTEIDNGEKDKSEEDGLDDFCILLDTLEAVESFLSENQRKFLLGNLKNVGANERKELTDEWKTLLAEEMELDIKKRTLLAEEMQLDIKKRTFSAKLVNIGFSA